MSPRVKGSKMPTVVSRSRLEREREITGHIEQGVQLPSAIAKAMSCSQELVMYYVRAMPSVEVRREQPAGLRLKNVLYLRQGAAA